MPLHPASTKESLNDPASLMTLQATGNPSRPLDAAVRRDHLNAALASQCDKARQGPACHFTLPPLPKAEVHLVWPAGSVYPRWADGQTMRFLGSENRWEDICVAIARQVL